MPQKLFTPISITSDIVIFTIENENLKVLLIKRVENPFKNQLALPGGFILSNETSKDAALRILEKKAGVKNVYTEQLFTFDDIKRDLRGRVISISHFALVPRESIKTNKKRGLQNPVFYSVKNLTKLAFDHKQIIRYAITRLQSKLEYTNVAFSILPKYFTFTQLQKTYEIILNKNLDKRNFRKKFMLLDLIKPTSKIISGARQRPARLYQFVSRKPTTLKKFF